MKQPVMVPLKTVQEEIKKISAELSARSKNAELSKEDRKIAKQQIFILKEAKLAIENAVKPIVH